MRPERDWMYVGTKVGGLISSTFVKNVDDFIEYALQQPSASGGNRIRCPCKKKRCQNQTFYDVDTVKFHLYKYGFVPDYYIWRFHGECEEESQLRRAPAITAESDDREYNSYHRMVEDVAGPEFQYRPESPQPPNPEAQRFYDMMRAADRSVYDLNENHSQLSAAVRMLDIKTKHQCSGVWYDDMSAFLQELLPVDNRMPKDFYSTKKLVQGLGLPVEVIHACENNCMIYWGADKDLNECKLCGHLRFKPRRHGSSKRRVNVPYKKMHYFPLTPRLQRLYASNATASQMRWHAEHVIDDMKISHPSDSRAWKHFNDVYPEFSSEVRNIRLGLCTDGFQPFGQSGQQYSLWPVIITPYNLPPGLCMKDEFMFLTVLVPGPRNPKGKIDIFLQPLIEELKTLWSDGVETYDVSTKTNFQMRAAVMWTINDFPAYSMLSGWSTAGKLACPHCMEYSDAISLRKSGKVSWFDNHRKFLPQEHPFRRNTRAFTRGKRVITEYLGIRSGDDILYDIESRGFLKVTEHDADRVNAVHAKSCG